MDPVQDQYETFPYPMRDPREEDHRLITGSPSARDEINHFLYGGARDWSRPFKALVAGGGTGDGLIMLAQQLADVGCPADITYIDLSTASRKIAEERAARRNLTSIIFHNGSLMDAADHGPFDYIDCCGVLHHLPDPLSGFKALRQALAPSGGMGIMVYGELGRTGVYDVQDLLRSLIKETESNSARVEIAKRLLNQLPAANRLRRNTFIKDHFTDDSGLFDLLLHSRDCAYRVPDIYDTLQASDLEMVGFVAPVNYDPDYVITDAKLKARLSIMSRRDRESFAELLNGNIKKHMFYCAPKGTKGVMRAATFSMDMIPTLHCADMKQIMPLMKAGKPLAGHREGLKVELPVPPRAADILALCDGNHSFKDIQQVLTPTIPAPEFEDQAKLLYRAFHGLNLMLLRQAL